jgi:hypothetical protein
MRKYRSQATCETGQQPTLVAGRILQLGIFDPCDDSEPTRFVAAAEATCDVGEPIAGAE